MSSFTGDRIDFTSVVILIAGLSTTFRDVITLTTATTNYNNNVYIFYTKNTDYSHQSKSTKEVKSLISVSFSL